MAIPIKSPSQIEELANLGRTLDAILAEMCTHAHPGVRTRELAQHAAIIARAHHVEPALLGYAHPNAPDTKFPAAACVNVNDEVTHSLPSVRILRAGDVATIDMAIRHAGWCIDAAATLVVGERATPEAGTSRATNLRQAARDVLDAALNACVPGRAWQEVIEHTQHAASQRGVSILTSYNGHGIGVTLHEPPTLQLDPALAGSDLILRPGMVLCLEPIVCESPISPPCITLDDAWTVVTANRTWAAFEEACIAITSNGQRLLAGASWRARPA